MQKNNSVPNAEPFNHKKAENDNKTGSAGSEKGHGRAGDKKIVDASTKGRLLQCIGNLNALHKVQGALLAQMEREIE